MKKLTLFLILFIYGSGTFAFSGVYTTSYVPNCKITEGVPLREVSAFFFKNLSALPQVLEEKLELFKNSAKYKGFDAVVGFNETIVKEKNEVAVIFQGVAVKLKCEKPSIDD